MTPALDRAFLELSPEARIELFALRSRAAEADAAERELTFLRARYARSLDDLLDLTTAHTIALGAERAGRALTQEKLEGCEETLNNYLRKTPERI